MLLVFLKLCLYKMPPNIVIDIFYKVSRTRIISFIFFDVYNNFDK